MQIPLARTSKNKQETLGLLKYMGNSEALNLGLKKAVTFIFLFTIGKYIFQYSQMCV